MEQEYKRNLNNSYVKSVEHLYYLHKSLAGGTDIDAVYFYDKNIKFTLDLLSALIFAKADAEVYSRFRSGKDSSY